MKVVNLTCLTGCVTSIQQVWKCCSNCFKTQFGARE